MQLAPHGQCSFRYATSMASKTVAITKTATVTRHVLNSIMT